MIMVRRTLVSVHSVVGQDEVEKWHDVPLMLMETIEPLEASVHQNKE